MIIFLYGPDSYRRLQKQLEIERVYRNKRGNMNEEHFDLSGEGELDKFKNFIVNRSMFGGVRMAVLENIYEVTDDKSFIEILKNEVASKDSAVIANANGEPPSKLKFLLEKPAQSQHFQTLESSKLEFFINKEAQGRGIKLTEAITKSIKSTFGNDTWGIATELDKIALMSNYITRERPKIDYFILMSTLKAAKNIKQGLVALETILSERRDDPARVFNSLSYGLNSKKEAKLFADYDVAVKSGKLDYEEILVDLTLS